MANDVNQNPNVIDSTGAVLNAMGGAEHNIKEMVWVGGGAATLVLVINGSPAITFTGPGAALDYGPLHHQHLGYIKSLSVTTITGKLLLFT